MILDMTCGHSGLLVVMRSTPTHGLVRFGLNPRAFCLLQETKPEKMAADSTQTAVNPVKMINLGPV